MNSISQSLPGRWQAGFAPKAVVMCILAALVFGFTAGARAAKKPLTKSDVLGLLKDEVEPAQVADAARGEGISFNVDAATERELRAAGADDNLISVLKELAPKSKSVSPPSNPPAIASPPILLIEATPGGAQVYIDDEPKATTSPQGRVKFSQLSPGAHVVRLSRAGYSDYEQNVDLKPGETSTVYATLTAVKAASPPDSAKAQSGGPPAEGNNSPPRSTQPASVQTPPANDANVARFLVAHDHGYPAGSYCVGWMTVGNGMIHYQGDRAFTSWQPGGATHSFDVSVKEIKDVKKNGVYLAQIGGFHIKLKKGTNINLVVIDAQGHFHPPDNILTAIDSQMNGR